MEVASPTLGPAYRALLKSPEPWVMVEGPRGTGKTVAILTMLVELARQHPGCRIALIRRYRADLTKSVLPSLEEEVFPTFGMTTPPGGFLQRSNRAEYLIGDPASRIVPIGLDSDGAGSLLSTAWSFAYAAEATEIPYELLIKLDGAMRWTRSPTRPTLPPRAQIIVDCNPTNPDHPLNLRAEDCADSLRMVRNRADYDRLQEYNNRRAVDPVKRWKRIITRIQDNPGFWDFAKWEYTPAGATYMNERMAGYTGYIKARWVDGLWKQPAGVVFPEYDSDIHIIPDFEPLADWPIVVAADPGFGTTCFLWITIAPDNSMLVFDEIYGGGKAFRLHCIEALKRNADKGRNVLRWLGDPNEIMSDRAQGVSCAAQARELGIRFLKWPADKGSAFDAGVEAVRNALNAKPGNGMYLRICRRCKGLQSNFGSWSFKKNRSGEVAEGADKYTEQDDHALDPLRGTIQSRFLQKMHASGEAADEPSE